MPIVVFPPPAPPPYEAPAPVNTALERWAETEDGVLVYVPKQD